MPPDEKEKSLEAEVAGLSSRVDAMQESLEENSGVTAGLREDVARLRGEVNGTLPRIDRNVERLFEKLDEHNGLVHACHERTQIHQNEIGTLFGALGSKADARSNEEAHSRLWLFLQISLFAIAAGALGVLLAKAYGI